MFMGDKRVELTDDIMMDETQLEDEASLRCSPTLSVGNGFGSSNFGGGSNLNFGTGIGSGFRSTGIGSNQSDFC